MTAWEVLGLSPGADRKAIRRAYADRLRVMEPETDPEVFQTLRDARDAALSVADGGSLSGDNAETVAPEPVTNPEFVEATDEPPATDVDLTELHRLRDMVMGNIPGADAAAIEEQGRRVLRDPALLNIDHAEAIETFLSELIYHGTPATDPLLGGMIAFFGWDAEENAATRTPLVNWILQRDVDRIFEIELRHQHKRWERLLHDLRTLSVYEWEARFRKPSPHEVEFLLSYLHNHHPTTVTGLPNEAMRWWQQRIEQRHARIGPMARIDNWRRRGTFIKGARDFGLATGEEGSFQMPVSIALLMIIGLLHIQRSCSEHQGSLDRPFVATTETPSEQGSGNTFEGASTVINANAGSSADRRPINTSAPVTPGFTEFDADLSAILNDVTRGHLRDVAELKQRNPSLYMQFREDWEGARAAGRSLGDWRKQVTRHVTTAFQRALAGSDNKLIIDNARFAASRLRWAARVSMAQCVDLIEGRAMIEPYDFSSYRGNLLSRAILAPPTTVRGSGGTFTIPPDIATDAAKRSGLGKVTFDAAMRGRGGAQQRCNAEIALLDAATIHGEDGVTMLRQMLGPK